jgi:hypothetical protein
MHLGHHDANELFFRALTRPLPEAKRMGTGAFMVVYAVSNNPRRVFDLSETASLLGYAPQDSVESFVAKDWQHIPKPKL